MAEIASAYVSLIPSFQGGTAAMSKELGAAAAPAGRDAGERAGAGFGESFRGLLGGAALFGGGALIASSFQSAVSQADLPGALRAEFGATEQVAEQAAQTAGTLYAQGWGESLGQVGSAVGAVNRALERLGTGESVERLSTQAQALADRFGEDVGQVISSASQMVEADLTPNMEAAFDVMATGFQSGANAGGDLLDTITEYSTQFSQLGLDGSTAMNLINQGMGEAGRNSDFVADAFKEFADRAVDGSKASAEGFQQLGLDAGKMAAKIGQGGQSASQGLSTVLQRLRDMEDPVQRDQAAMALFGERAVDLGDSLYALDPAAAAASGGMDKVGGAAQQVADTAGSSMQQQMQSLGRTLQSSLGSALQTVAPMLKTLMTALKPLLPVLAPMALAIGVVVAAQWAWNAALLANPLVWIVALVVGFIAAIVLAWQRSETFRAVITAVWNAIKTAIGAVIDWLVGTAWPLIQTVWDGIVAGVTWVKNLVVGAWNAIVAGLKTAAGWLRDRWNWLVGVIRKAADKIGGFLAGIWDGIKAGARNAVNGAIGILNGAIGAINGLIRGANKLPGVSIPQIPGVPYLASGGVVTGPTLAMVGEGGEDEAVLPLSKLDAMLADSGGQTVVVDGRGLDRALTQWLQHAVRVQGGGSVQRFAGR